MDPLTALAVALGSAWGSGLNLYATVLVLGGLDAFGVISLPDSMAVLSSTWGLAAAASFLKPPISRQRGLTHLVRFYSIEDVIVKVG